MKKSLYVFIVMFMAIMAFSCTPRETKNEVYTLVVLHTNDHHGHPLAFDKYPVKQIGGMPARATLISRIRNEFSNVLLVDAGDMNTGRPESVFFNAEPDIVGMNYMKYDAMVLGNHEFDAGLDVLKKQIKQAEFPFLSANILKKGGEEFVKPYIIKQFKGFTVAILGLTTSTVRSVGNPEMFTELEVHNEIHIAQKLVPELRKQADIVIAVTHMGTDPDDQKNEYGARRLAAEVPGIDLIVDGHTHTILQSPLQIGSTRIVQAGDWGIFLGMVTITLEKGQITSFNGKLLPINDKRIEKTADGQQKVVFVGEEIPEDPALAALLKPYNDKVDAVLGEKIGHAPVALLQENVRKEEVPLGNLVADAMQWYTSIMTIDGAVDFSIQNGGGVRSTMPQGDITKRIIYEILPFDNSVVVCVLKGSQVKDLFAFLATIPPNSGAFPQVSKEVSFTLNYAEGKCENILINGKPIDDKKTYRVATNSYMADGGDKYRVFKESLRIDDTSKFQRDVLIEYIKRELKGNILPIKPGRIKIVPAVKTSWIMKNKAA